MRWLPLYGGRSLVRDFCSDLRWGMGGAWIKTRWKYKAVGERFSLLAFIAPLIIT